MKLYIIIFILFTFIIIYNYFKQENFNNKYYKDIYKTSLFDNKTIFIIANNPNLSKKTIIFLNKYNFDKNTLVIRFNGNRTNKDLSNIKDNIMIFRHNTNGDVINLKSTIIMHGLSKDNYNEKIHNVLLSENVDKFNYNNFFNKYNFINKNSSKIYFNVTNPPPKEYNLKKYKWGMTSGVNTLISLLNNNKYKKIYLIGFNLYGGTDKFGHNFPYEYKFINKITKDNKNVKIML